MPLRRSMGLPKPTATHTCVQADRQGQLFVACCAVFAEVTILTAVSNEPCPVQALTCGGGPAHLASSELLIQVLQQPRKLPLSTNQVVLSEAARSLLAVNGTSCFRGHVLDGRVNEIIKQRPMPLLPVTALLLGEGCRCCCAHNDQPAALCSGTPQGAVVDTCTGVQPMSLFKVECWLNGTLQPAPASPAPCCKQLACCCSSIFSFQHLGKIFGACGLTDCWRSTHSGSFAARRAMVGIGRGFVERAQSAQQHINALQDRPDGLHPPRRSSKSTAWQQRGAHLP